MSILLYQGIVADTPVELTDKIRISVPDMMTMPRKVYGPLPFNPIVSGHGGTRLPQAGDRAVVGVEESTGDSWVVEWHRDDTTPPPYTEEGGSGGGGEPGPPGPPGPTGATGAAGGQSYTQPVGDGSSQAFTITHSLGFRGVMVSVYSATAPYDEVEAEVEHTDANTVTVRTTSIPSPGQYIVVVAGPGAAGGSGGADLNYVHNQASLSALWSVTHNLGKFPSVSVVDTGNTEVVSDVHYIDANSLTISFAAATSGKAYMN